MKIRLATLLDVPIVTEFNLRLADETEQLKLDPETVRAGVATVLGDASKGLYLLADLDGRIAGQLMITYEWSDWRNGNLWWLQSVYVHPEYRSRGVFRALFSHLTELARAREDVVGLRTADAVVVDFLIEVQALEFLDFLGFIEPRVEESCAICSP